MKILNLLKLGFILTTLVNYSNAMAEEKEIDIPAPLRKIPFHVTPKEVYKLEEVQQAIREGLAGKRKGLTEGIFVWHALKAFEVIVEEEDAGFFETVEAFKDKLKTYRFTKQEQDYMRDFESQLSPLSDHPLSAKYYKALQNIREEKNEEAKALLLECIDEGSVDAAVTLLKQADKGTFSITETEQTLAFDRGSPKGFSKAYLEFGISYRLSNPGLALRFFEKAAEKRDIEGTTMAIEFSSGEKKKTFEEKRIELLENLSKFMASINGALK